MGSCTKVTIWFRPEHACSGQRDKAARNQAFPMRAKIIRQTGNDTALSSSKSFQSGSCYFLRRFRPVSEFFLPCNDMKLGFRRTGAESANPDSVRLHFLGETLGKEQIKGFRRGIGGNVGNRLKRSRRGEDQD